MAPVCSRFWVVSGIILSLFLLIPAILFWSRNAGDRFLLVTSFPALVRNGGVALGGPPSPPCPTIPNATVSSNVTVSPNTVSCSWEEKEWTAEQLDACPNVKALLRVWNNSLYFDGEGLAAKEHLDASWPPPPHLVDCDRVSEEERGQDTRLPNGGFPGWANRKGFGGNPVPDPFWVSGADADNAPLTRQVQQDLWLRQHPLNCSAPDVRFLVAEWSDTSTHGLGSQLHLLEGGLALAVMTRRVFVVDDNFERALHEGCTGDSKGKLDCYVLPATSKECAAIALAEKGTGLPTASDAIAAANSKEKRVVMVPGYVSMDHLIIDLIPGIWGEPWTLKAGSIEFEGKMVDETIGPFDIPARHFGPMNWWRAQATRYLLRAPSAYLCRLVNQARHEAFGVGVAARLVESMRFQQERSPRKLGFLKYGEMEERLWRGDLYAPRPFISVHVRHAYEKSGEMRIVELPEFMEQAERIRQHNPAVRSIWLSTESRDIVDQAISEYTPHWRLYYTKAERIHSSERDPWNTHTPAREGSDLAFANLFIAADADYFVGVLGSNWNRLIDELRKTNGKDKAGYIALNYDQNK